MRKGDIQALLQDPAIGPKGFVRVLAGLVEGRDSARNQIPKLRPEDVSFQMLWEACVGPMDQTLEIAQRGGRGGLNYVEVQEAVDSTVFPSATGVLIAAKVIEGYDQPGYIGDELVTIMTSRLKSERLVGFTSLEGPMETPEGMPYAESSFGEKYVTTETAKKGRILEVTEETIYFDQTGQILLRAQRLGEMTRQEREETILAGVLDVGGAAGVGPYKPVYRPNGTAAALYSTANGNLLSTATPLVDWTDINEVLQHHATTIRDDRAASGERRPIIWMPKVVLTADELAGTAARILSATEVRSGDITTGVGTQMITGNPLATRAPGLRAMASPLIDYLAGVTSSNYDDASDWLIGDFKRQFIWQEIWPVQTARARQDDDAAFRRDIVARFKVRYYGGIAALDHRYVVKVNAV